MERWWGIRLIIAGVLLVPAALALYWLIVTTNSEGDPGDPELLVVGATVPLLLGVVRLARSRSMGDEPRTDTGKLRGDVVLYVVVNTYLIGAWAVTGFGSFWPAAPIGIWGAVLLIDALKVRLRHGSGGLQGLR